MSWSSSSGSRRFKPSASARRSLVSAVGLIAISAENEVMARPSNPPAAKVCAAGKIRAGKICVAETVHVALILLTYTSHPAEKTHSVGAASEWRPHLAGNC